MLLWECPTHSVSAGVLKLLRSQIHFFLVRFFLEPIMRNWSLAADSHPLWTFAFSSKLAVTFRTYLKFHLIKQSLLLMEDEGQNLGCQLEMLHSLFLYRTHRNKSSVMHS